MKICLKDCHKKIKISGFYIVQRGFLNPLFCCRNKEFSLKKPILFIYFKCQIKFSRGEIYKVSLSNNKDDQYYRFFVFGREIFDNIRI